MSPVERICTDLTAAIEELRGQGYRLDLIYPADDPHTAVLSGQGPTVRLTNDPEAPPPSGNLPEFRPRLAITSTDGSAAQGRAGMLYRDLIPGRLGGRYIASHIRIAEGGPVADWVHFHRVAFQMIAVVKGWARVVYEDQGDPFVIEAGDVVLQPPEIRHRVLDSSDGLEVIEIGCPALHETFADHDLELPTGHQNPDREFGGQLFLHHAAARAPWTEFHGWKAQETAMKDSTRGLAAVRTIRPGGSATLAIPAHDGELVFGFVIDGSAALSCCLAETPLRAGDAFVIPPAEPWTLVGPSDDLKLLHVITERLDATV